MGDMDRHWLVAVAVAVARRPALWWTALRQIFTLAEPGWWKRRPFLPTPDPDYVKFRMVTAYGGDGTAAPTPQDVVTYLQWCRQWARRQ